MATIKHNDYWFNDDENYDYSTEIQKAVDAGDLARAAYLEKSRNTKLDYYADTLGQKYEKTYKYQDYLPNVGKGSSPTVTSGKGSYADNMDVIMKNIQGKKFSYDPKSDPLYKQIKENYKNTADDVIENTMGTYAGMTGGVPSSYATSAAAQAGAAHLGKADEMIPELYELAYTKFADDKADLYKQYGIYAGLEEQEYDRGLDARDYADYLDDKQWNRDTYLEEQAYQRDIDNWEMEEDAEEDAIRDENNARSIANDAYARVMDSLASGMLPNQADIDASGYFDEGTTSQKVLDDYNAGLMNRLGMQAAYSGGGSGNTGLTAEEMLPFIEFRDELQKMDNEGKQSDGGSFGERVYDYVVSVLPYVSGKDDDELAENLKKSLLDHTEGYNIDIADMQAIWNFVFGNRKTPTWLNEYIDIPKDFNWGRYANLEHPEYSGVISKKVYDEWTENN